MPPLPRCAILIDGVFAIRKLATRRRAFPTCSDIATVAAAIAKHDCVRGLSQLRVYFYHAHPATQVLINPISKRKVSLETTRVHADHARLLRELEVAPDFALRLGEISTIGWKLGQPGLCGHTTRR